MGDWVVRLIEQSGYLGVAFLMFLETVFPPIPSEIIMPVAGVAAAQHKLSLPWVIASGTAGAMLGNLVWYLAARALGIERLRPLINRHGRWLGTTWSELERAQRWFAGHGVAFVFLGRLIPTVRSLVSVPAGLLKMRLKTFVLASLAGTAAWTAMLTFAGVALGERYQRIDVVLGPVSNLVLGLLLLMYLHRLWTHRHIRPK